MIEQKIKSIEQEALSGIDSAKRIDELEALNIKYLGRKGVIVEIMGQIPSMPAQEKPLVGRLANELKNRLAQAIALKGRELKSFGTRQPKASIDVTMPGLKPQLGRIHPITKTINDILDVFKGLGFKSIEGPEIETEFNNFQALNIPLEHPSRDAFDTFYLDNVGHRHKEKFLLRSHTSPVQVRVMQAHKPPLAIVVPGKVYRPDAVDASHLFMFHQIEGLMVDKEISFADLKSVLEIFIRRLFGKEALVRFRPHFFPFTEPSAEVDVSCLICKGEGCSVCGHKGWLEILGSGSVHPNVFKACRLDPKAWTGFAFGMGVERIAMLKYGIDDIRLFYENDIRFLEQF